MTPHAVDPNELAFETPADPDLARRASWSGYLDDLRDVSDEAARP